MTSHDDLIQKKSCSVVGTCKHKSGDTVSLYVKWLSWIILLQRKPRGGFCLLTPPLHHGQGTSEEKIAETQYLTHKVGLISPWGGKPRRKYDTFDRWHKYDDYIAFYQPDIDECAARNDSCDANSVCSNTNGSYDCQCTVGYVKNGGICEGAIYFGSQHEYPTLLTAPFNNTRTLKF